MASGGQISQSSRAGGVDRVRVGGGSAPRVENGAARELSEIQRARVIAAMFDAATARGVASVTVADVVERAGVSRRTFYELFSDSDDCFRVAFECALASATTRVLSAYEAQDGWRGRVRAGLVALLGFLDEEPVAGRVLIVESAGGGTAVLERRSEVIQKLTSAIGEMEGEAQTPPPPLMTEGVVRGVLAVIHSRLAEHDQNHDKESLVTLVKPLMGMIVLTHLGQAAARRELRRPSPEPVRVEHPEQLGVDHFKDTGLRLTYRTVRVLAAIAEHPGASNRLIAASSDIKDQGQISKLLTRLQRAGMITNNGPPPGNGAPNSWTLTTNGHQIIATLNTHTTHHAEGAL